MAKNCPVCREALSATTFGGITVDGCHACGGVWFDRGELARLAHGDLTQLAAIDSAFGGAAPGGDTSDPAGTRCPVCATGLKPFEPPQTPGLQLIGCPAGHGTWLREDDFERLIERVDAWRARPENRSQSAAPRARQRLRDIAHLLLSQPCPECRQPNATASPVCWACGAILQAAGARFCCPTCGEDLKHLILEATLLNQCAACGGLWLDAGELGDLILLPRERLRQLQPASTAASAAGESPRGVCPTCQFEMRYHEYGPGSGVFIHFCDGCRGLWTDPAGLVGIQQFAHANENFLAPDEA